MKDNDDTRRIEAVERELERLKNDLAAIQATFAELALQITKSVGRQSEHFDRLVQMNHDLSKSVSEIQMNVTALQQWKAELSNTRRKTHAIKKTDQKANNAALTVAGLIDYYDRDSLDVLIFEMGLRPEDYKGIHKRRCHQLVSDAMQQGFFWRLVNHARKERPHYLWPTDTGELSE